MFFILKLIFAFPLAALSFETINEKDRIINSSLSRNYDETFQYSLSWKGIRAGTAWLGIKRDGERIRVFSRVRSASFISLFYEVDDLVETILEPVDGLYPGRPLHYRIKLKEGKYRRDKEVIFKGDMAIYKNNLRNEIHEAKIPGEVFDPLSAFFYIRFMPLEPGRSIYITVFDSKKVWNVEVQVLRKEKIKIEDKEVNTIVIKPLMQSEGIFYRKGDIYIWLSDDSSRRPVMLKTKVLIGSVVAMMEK
ncbi:MAG: DUF3108 domain-containing protein [Thermodesulfovibrionales bacterium]|nr:DUF3108 domain-containing protein [Thermodesulfovibrionales bacterium]